MDGARRQLMTIPTATEEQMGVEVVDVFSGQLRHRQVTEQRAEVATHQAAGFPDRGG